MKKEGKVERFLLDVAETSAKVGSILMIVGYLVGLKIDKFPLYLEIGVGLGFLFISMACFAYTLYVMELWKVEKTRGLTVVGWAIGTYVVAILGTMEGLNVGIPIWNPIVIQLSTKWAGYLLFPLILIVLEALGILVWSIVKGVAIVND